MELKPNDAVYVKMGKKVSLRTDDLSGQFKEYINKLKNRDSLHILTISSVLISVLFRFQGLGAYALNLLYFVNISYFALIARDSWAIRNKNIIPLIATALSILLTSLTVLEILDGIDMMMSIGESLEQMYTY